MKKKVLISLHGGPGMDYSEIMQTFFQVDEIESISYSHGAKGNLLKNLIDELDDVVKRYVGCEIYLIGHSFGGCLALEYVSKCFRNVAGIIVLNSPISPEWLDEFSSQNDGYKQEKINALDFSYDSDTCYKKMTTIYKDLYFYQVNEEKIKFLEEKIKYNYAIYENLSGYLSSIELIDVLNSITVSTYLIFSKNDSIITYDYSKHAIKKITNKNIKIDFIDNAGHFSFIDRPEVVKELVIGYLISRDDYV